MLVGSLACLIYVLIFGMEIKGAQRWIHLPGFSLQPSEFAKPAFIVVAGVVLSQSKKDIEKLPWDKDCRCYLWRFGFFVGSST